ncbi:unnamed protein product, partial [Effrenium voratum]
RAKESCVGGLPGCMGQWRGAVLLVGFILCKQTLFARVGLPRQGGEVLFLDCDDCLYQNNWTTADKLTESIAHYTARLGVSEKKAYDLYQEYGTALKGLLAEKILDREGAEVYLQEVHKIDLSDIAADPRLAQMLRSLRCPTWIFTASTREHVKRCIRQLGLPQFEVIDTRACRLETKHSPSSFQVAMKEAGVHRPECCILCDDSVKNIRAAKAMDWRTVLVGLRCRERRKEICCEEADFHIRTIHQLPAVMPELFLWESEASDGAGLAALWMTSSQILGMLGAFSPCRGFSQARLAESRLYSKKCFLPVPIELLLLSTGCQIAGGPTPALWACGCCFCCTALALALQGYAWSAWSCQLLLRPWWDPEGCPVPGAPLASALLAGSLCSWLPLRRLSRPKWLLAVWVSAAAPQLWAATRQVDSTWLWPAALLVDLLLGVGARPKGACVSTAAEKQSPSWRAGALADLLALALVVVLLAEPPVPEPPGEHGGA